MEYFPQTEVTVEPSFKIEAAVTVEGNSFHELKVVKILFSRGILFSAKKGKARRETPIPYLRDRRRVPETLKYVVIPKGGNPGIKLWGKIDFLVNHRGYRLMDERSKR